MNQKSSLKKIKNIKFLKVCETIVAEMKRLKIPGVAIGVFHNGKEYTAGFGVTSIENPLAVTPDTLFQTGSISKTSFIKSKQNAPLTLCGMPKSLFL